MCTADDCPIGRLSESGASFCFECAVGFFGNTSAAPAPRSTESSDIFGNATSKVTCDPCRPGKYGVKNVSTGKVSCAACPAGYVAGSTGLSLCLPCMPGLAQDTQGSADCIGCVTGKFQNLPGKPNCTDCARGRAAEKPGTVNCLQCSPGMYAVSGGLKCDTCMAGQYSNDFGQTKCKPISASQIVGEGGKQAVQKCPRIFVAVSSFFF